jgi:hypothetical protein
MERPNTNAAIFALLLWMGGMALVAQTPTVTPETQIDAATLEQWLHSSDPRLIAWAAYFVTRDADKQILDEIPGVLERAAIPSPQGRGGDQRLALLALLDTVIQQSDVRVSADAVARVATTFPAQALVLIGRLPFGESGPVLNDWSYGMTPSWDSRRLERVSAMMLAQHPDREFVARIASDAGQTMTIHIASTASGFGGASGSCGDVGAGAPLKGWPPIYNYDLVENDSQESPLTAGAQVVIDLAGDRVVARRFKENQPWGSCNGVENLDDTTRHRLLAYWLGVKPAEMIWQPQSEAVIVWADQAGYERKLGALIDEQRKKMKETIASLRNRRLLGDEHANPIEPRITVSIQCDVDPCPVK